LSKKNFAALAKKYKSPKSVQDWLRTFKYNKKETLYSASLAIEKKSAHCLEGAFVAAAILEQHGFPPLIMSFESIDDLEHVVFVFKIGKKWGSIGKSRDPGLHGRAPQFNSLRALAWSYFDPYIDNTGRITAYQLANLDELGVDWRTGSKNLWAADKYLVDLPHRPLKSSSLRFKKVKSQYKKKGPILNGPFWW
jgi:hypothetical protein